MDPYTGKGIADGINQGINNYYSLKAMKKNLGQKEESFNTQHKIDQLQLKQLENEMSPERVALKNQELKLKKSAINSMFKVSNFKIDEGLTKQQNNLEQTKTFLQGGAIATSMNQAQFIKNGEVDYQGFANKRQEQNIKSNIDSYLSDKDASSLTTGQRQNLVRMAGTNKNLQGYLKNILPKKATTDANPYGLSSSDRLAVRSLAVKKFGKRKGMARENLDLFEQQLAEGKTIDDIEDEQRLKLQSAGFKEDARFAVENVMGLKYTEERKQNVLDTYDNMAQRQGEGQANNYLKRLSRQEVGTKVRENVEGQERTIDFLGEIKDDLEEYTSKGGNTGFFTGKYESILSKIGRTKDPELKKIATKIKTKLIKFRKENTGTAFSAQEAAEYKAIFPDVGSVNLVNLANIDALRETFTGDVDNFYAKSMGQFYYDNVKGVGAIKQTSQAQQDSYQEGQTATNPQTGEKLVLKNGQWVSAGGQ